MSLQSFQTVFCSSRRQYRDYIIDLYGVKDSTMSYSKCAMPPLSCLLSFYTIPISIFFEFKEFFYFLVSLLFLCMHAYIKSSCGAEVPKNIVIFSDSGNVGLRVCSFMITHMQCFMLIVVYKVICIHCLRLVAIGYDYVTLP